MRAASLKAGKLITEPGLEQPTTQSRQDFADRNILCLARQRIPACLSANALHKFASPQDSHQFGDISNGQGFRASDFGNREAFAFSGARNTEKASQPILFLCTQFHIIPSCNLALSDIFSGFHGGSQVSSTIADLTPSVAFNLDSTSSGSDAATGQFGAVRVIFIRTSAESLISIPYTRPSS